MVKTKRKRLDGEGGGGGGGGKRLKEGRWWWGTGKELTNEIQSSLASCCLWESGLFGIISSFAEPYVRHSGEEVEVHVVSDPRTADFTMKAVRVGDLIIEEKGRYRHTESHAVTLHPQIGLRTKSISNESGYGAIPSSVSRYIFDPISFYQSLQNPLAGDYFCDMASVELDVEAHQHLLRQLTGGRPVSPKRQVFLDMMSKDLQVCVIGPKSPDVPDQYVSGSICPLNEETPDEIIGGSDLLPADPVVEQERKLNKHLYEVLAHDCFIKSPKGTQLSLSSLPSMDGSSSGSCSYLQSIEIDPADGKKVLSVTTTCGIIYRPEVVIDRGPFGGVRVWASPPHKNQGWAGLIRDQISIYRSKQEPPTASLSPVLHY